ncbi:MAG TPA: CaiB/BaiF CoA-transferase family protein [Accumulibacter sp.]|nr:CaiB/BaiF CoA-transferase family protein [Accumulibacter sp.]
MTPSFTEQDDLPLSGITVVSLEHAIAAPFASRQLADLGARVIKIERPGTGDFARAYDHRVDGLASHFVWTNRAKESLTLDLKHPAAREVLARLLQKTDVLIQNLAPGAAARLGLSYAALAADHPGIIVCDISGYGEGGPYSAKKAYDLMIQSESGFLSVTGSPDAEAKAGVSIADIATGMYAYSTILAAIIQRQKTGKGRRIEISMLEAMVEWMGFPLYYAYKQQSAPLRAGAAHATIFPYGAFRTGDGYRVMLGLQNEREWGTFCAQVLQRPEMKDDPRFASNALRSEHRTELQQVINEIFGRCTCVEIVDRLEAADIANARVNTLDDVWQHAQLQARARWAMIDSPVGRLPSLLPPGADADNPARLGPVPALGEHTEAILGELGFAAHIACFRQQGLI